MNDKKAFMFYMMNSVGLNLVLQTMLLDVLNK